MVRGRNGMGRIGKRAKWQGGEKIREQGDNGAKRVWGELHGKGRNEYQMGAKWQGAKREYTGSCRIPGGFCQLQASLPT
jgi:hypothetical protein